jgi:aminomethyltransferase
LFYGAGECTVADVTSSRVVLAVQGPAARELLSAVVPDAAAVPRFEVAPVTYAGGAEGFARSSGFAAGTGYTGEDGVELHVPAERAAAVWSELLDAGLVPAGLGARDTLRLEAKMALYGNDIDDDHTPLEAGLGWAVKLDKGDFLGRDALVKQKDRGIARKLIGFEMKGRGIGRDGYEVYVNGVAAGWVTSGGPAPALNKNIGMCYLPVHLAEAGRGIEVMVRGRGVEAVTIPIPFYKRAK